MIKLDIITGDITENKQKFIERLYGGDVDSLPLLDADGKSLPCSYCDYKSVCGNFPPSRMKKYSLDEE